jgi:hypothetical protein
LLAAVAVFAALLVPVAFLAPKPPRASNDSNTNSGNHEIHQQESRQKPEGDATPLPGELGYLDTEGMCMTMVAASSKVLSKAEQAMSDNDRYGLAKLEKANLLWRLPEHTRVRVLSGGDLTGLRFRIIEGAHEGKVGWAPREKVHTRKHEGSCGR